MSAAEARPYTNDNPVKFTNWRGNECTEENVIMIIMIKTTIEPATVDSPRFQDLHCR